MGKRLELKSIRKISIVEPSNIHDTYKGLVSSYWNELMMDLFEMKNSWFEKYYLSSYEQLCNKCKDFIEGKYVLNISFENACELYNHFSERDFDKFLKFEGDLNEKLATARINYISLELEGIMKNIFKKEQLIEKE